MKILLPLAAALMVSGCVSMGTNFPPEAVEQLKPGMMKSEVIALMGKPNSTTTMADGKTVLGWVHSKGSMFGANARSVSLQFGNDGKLIDTGQLSQVQVR